MKALVPLLTAVLILGVAAESLAEGRFQGPLRKRMAERLEQRAQPGRAAKEHPVDLQAILPGARKTTAAYGPDRAQQLDIYTPPGAKDAPIIVMVHGGAWKVGDKANAGVVENKLKYWLPKGYVLVSVNYRMLPAAMAYEQALDVAQALEWTQARAQEWGGDNRKIILMGHSAGAHLVALLSSRPSMVRQGWAGTVVLDSATLKVSETMQGRHPDFYDEAFGGDPAYWAKASPMDQWTPEAIPMMVVCSTRRPDKPCNDAKAFQALVRRQGRDMPVLTQDLIHADINTNLGLPGAYTTAVDAFIRTRIEFRR